MAGVNQINILGRLGRSPELSYTPSGMAICKFSIATSEKNKQGEEKTEWHRCTAFSKSAEIINQYVDKGDELFVSGKMSYGKYQKDGHDVYTADVLVNQFSFISGKKSGNQQNNQQQNQGYQNQGQQQGYQQQQGGYSNTNSGGGYGAPPDSDIPF